MPSKYSPQQMEFVIEGFDLVFHLPNFTNMSHLLNITQVFTIVMQKDIVLSFIILYYIVYVSSYTIYYIYFAYTIYSLTNT